MDRRIYPNLTTLGIRVNEAAQEIIFRSVTAGVEGSEELILTLRTEPLRCEIHRREVSSMLQQSKRPYDAQLAEGAWPMCIRGSVAKWSRVQADALMMSRRSTLQNASLKEPSESTEYPWRKSIPAEELTTDSVPLPVGPIAMWEAAMITSYDMMMIEFTSDKASWNILQRTRHTSVARMFVRDQPQSVRFMIIVSDPLNLSQRLVIKVIREVTDTIHLICSPQAPLEMFLMTPLLPRPKKKPLIGQTHADRANVGKIDKPNAEIVASRDDKSDIAKGTKSQINDVAKTEREKAVEAKTDAVAENKTGGVPQECDSKTNAERSTGAPQQQTQQSQQPSSSTTDAGTSAQRTAEQVVDAPVATGAGVQRTVEQIIDVPDDAEEQAQQRPVEQIVSVATETTIQATATLDRAELDVTQQVTPRVQSKAAPKAAPKFECSLRRSTRLECERVRYQEQAKRRFKRARERSAASSARRAPFRRSGFSGP